MTPPQGLRELRKLIPEPTGIRIHWHVYNEKALFTSGMHPYESIRVKIISTTGEKLELEGKSLEEIIERIRRQIAGQCFDLDIRTKAVTAP